MWESDSMRILVQWLTTPGNYRRWCSGEEGIKHSLSSQIALLLNKEGMPGEFRSAHQVRCKIRHLERQYSNALTKQLPHSCVITDAMRKACPYFAMIDPVFCQLVPPRDRAVQRATAADEEMKEEVFSDEGAGLPLAQEEKIDDDEQDEEEADDAAGSDSPDGQNEEDTESEETDMHAEAPPGIPKNTTYTPSKSTARKRSYQLHQASLAIAGARVKEARIRLFHALLSSRFRLSREGVAVKHINKFMPLPSPDKQ